jgi:5-methyltetrahydrofolate--homocysteine methyltransferase
MNVNWAEFQAGLLEFLLAKKSDEAIALAREALGRGASPAEFFEKCVTPVLIEIGNRFETLDIFLPEMVVAAEIVQELNDRVITPALELASQDKPTSSLGKVLLATVQGDLHDIGKSMVALMLRVNGFEVIDLGIDVSPSTIVEQAEKEQVDIIGMSALLTTCLPYMKDTVDYLAGTGLRDKYAVIIGGAAPTADFAEQVGVDGYGHSAAEAVTLCRNLMKERA